MKRILYLDCSSGISGDMFLGSLIDCGLDIRHINSQLRKIEIGKYRLKTRRVKRAGITGVKFDVIYKRHHGHEHTEEKTFRGIAGAIKRSSLSDGVKEKSLAVFANLAKAESRAHGVALDKVHFHEVGDIDSIIDIVGACIGLEYLEIAEVFTSRIVSGNGTVHVHGAVFPNPAPATAFLLKGFDFEIADVPYELVTPTGAAIINTFSKQSEEIPPMKIQNVGYGAGNHEIPDRPNMLRSFIGEATEGADTDIVSVLESNIDDMNPQVYGYLAERLFAAGALDVYIIPVIMKKSRPGCVLTVIAKPADTDKLSDIIFEETPTFGVRRNFSERRKLERKIVEVNTKYGKINVKLGFFKGVLKTYSPEYEDCIKAARVKRIPFLAVRDEAEKAAKRINREKQGI